LKPLVLVRFQLPLPNKNTLRDATVVTARVGEDKKPKHADGLAWRNVFLFGKSFNKEIVMKRKQTVRERNCFVRLALFRKAGVHRKSNKALRKAQNQLPVGV